MAKLHHGFTRAALRNLSAKIATLPVRPGMLESEESWRAGNPAPRPEPNKKRSPHRVRNAPQKRKENKKNADTTSPGGAGGVFTLESAAVFDLI